MKLFNLLESFIAGEYYVIVFDLCSSSVLLEKIQEQNELRVWKKFWEDIFKYLNKISSNGARCVVYKFIGDGFILLYRPQYAKSILSFCDSIKIYINGKVDSIVKEHINEYPERIGITIGIEKGKLIQMRLYGNIEYMGRAINVAARLQSILRLPEHSNKLLVSVAVKNEIHEQINDRACKPVEVTLRNLYGNESVTCYEIETK